ncbi:MAG: toxin-antitoxin system YwqK family antitoxin, partial [Saprospiraceae bacterium]|nr:toxin-antitoxin system YwqK family antitoxin [Saprospiraceae bacterium]
GKVEVVEHYENDVHHGLYQVFYENENIKLQGQYVAGSMEGEWQGFYEDGTLKEKVTFKENQENGAFTEYHPNGNVKAKGNYLNGDREEGLLELFDEYGDLERTMQCKQGRCETTWTRMKT